MDCLVTLCVGLVRQFRIKQKLSFRCCHRPIWLICGWGVRWRPQNCQFLVNTGPYRPPNLPYPYGRSIFKIHFFAILIADSDLSQKSVYTNYFSFLKILMGTLSKMQKTINNRPCWTYPLFWRFFAFLIMFLLEFLKKENSLCRHFFETNLNLQSELQKNEFWKSTSHRGKVNLGAGRVQYLQEIGIFEVAIKFLS